VCDRRSGQLTGYQNVAPHESNLPYLRRIKAAGRMKRADSISNRLFGRELNNAPAAPSTFRTISSDRSKGALQSTRIADHNPPHRHLQATGLQVPTLATVLAHMEDLDSAELSPGQGEKPHP
jgi:hypothetical protein